MLCNFSYLGYLIKNSIIGNCIQHYLGDIRENDKSQFRVGKPNNGGTRRRAKGRKVEERGKVRTHEQERGGAFGG
jgi:hypothetical protein